MEALGLLANTTFEIIIDGHRFRLRKLSLQLAYSIYGPNALNLMVAESAAESGQAKENKLYEHDVCDMIRKYCLYGMYEPRLAVGDEKTEPAAGVYRFEDLGKYALEIFRAIKDSGGDAVDFRGSSEDHKGP